MQLEVSYNHGHRFLKSDQNNLTKRVLDQNDSDSCVIHNQMLYKSLELLISWYIGIHEFTQSSNTSDNYRIHELGKEILQSKEINLVIKSATSSDFLVKTLPTFSVNVLLKRSDYGKPFGLFEEFINT